MKKLSGWVFLIVGGAIAFSSYYLDNKRGTEELIFFLFAGYLFMVIGLVKVSFTFLKNQTKKSKEKKPSHPHQNHQKLQKPVDPLKSNHRTNHSNANQDPLTQARNQNQPQSHTHAQPRFCRHCGKPIQHHGFYCIYCGSRIR